MTRRPRDPIADELKRAAGAAACGGGLHLPPNRNGKCPRCKKQIPASQLLDAGFFGLAAAVAGMFFQGLRHGQQLSHNFDPSMRGGTPIFSPPAIDWRWVLQFGPGQPVSAEQVNRRFKSLARMCHPDPVTNEGGDPELFIKITAARDAALKELGT